MRTNNWRNVSALLVAGCICCAMPSCSDDDAPAVIEAAQPSERMLKDEAVKAFDMWMKKDDKVEY